MHLLQHISGIRHLCLYLILLSVKIVCTFSQYFHKSSLLIPHIAYIYIYIYKTQRFDKRNTDSISLRPCRKSIPATHTIFNREHTGVDLKEI